VDRVNHPLIRHPIQPSLSPLTHTHRFLADNALFLYQTQNKISPVNLAVITSWAITHYSVLQLLTTFMKAAKIFGISRGEWNAMSFYGRLEQAPLGAKNKDADSFTGAAGLWTMWLWALSDFTQDHQTAGPILSVLGF
jgi:hypothetical protein